LSVISRGMSAGLAPAPTTVTANASLQYISPH
jgi:hypothetical protein